MAGNETVVDAAQRDKRLAFTESEPGCRTSLEPCIFPDRPEVAALRDGEGLLRPEEPLVLNLDYDTLLVQSTVWSDDLELRLEYREASLSGLPAGPWVEGLIEVGPAAERRFCIDDVTDQPSAGCMRPPNWVRDDVIPLYWDHPGLPQVPIEVRLKANNVDGQEIVSPAHLFFPEVPLALHHLGADVEGDHFQVTNVSSGVVVNISLEMRMVDDRGVEFWEFQLPVVNRLEPGQVATIASGCKFVSDGGELLRAAGLGSFGEEAVSYPVAIPDREGYSKLYGERFVRGTCPAGSPIDSGLFGIQHEQPCDRPTPQLAEFLGQQRSGGGGLRPGRRRSRRGRLPDLRGVDRRRAGADRERPPDGRRLRPVPRIRRPLGWPPQRQRALYL